MKFFSVCALLLLAASASAFGTKGGQLVSQRYEEQTAAVAAASGEANPEPYSFSYSTGSGDASDTRTARHFREETKDVHGVVVGKYGYVDPYGKLRVVHYRAGPEGYTVTGDTGPDTEVQREQAALYSADKSYQEQQRAWNSIRNTESAAAVASASAVHSSNLASSSDSREWSSVSGGNTVETLSDKYRVESAVKSPASQIRETTYLSRYTAPAIKSPTAQIRQYSHYTAQAVPVPVPARIVAKKVVTSTTTTHHHSPAARLVQQWNSRSNYGSSSAYTSGQSSYTSTSGVKGYSGAIKAAPARYSAPPASRGHTVVNFSQGGPVSYKYSYSF